MNANQLSHLLGMDYKTILRKSTSLKSFFLARYSQRLYYTSSGHYVSPWIPFLARISETESTQPEKIEYKSTSQGTKTP